METNSSSSGSLNVGVKLISIKELISQSLTIYKLHFKKLIAMSLLPVLGYISMVIVAGLFYMQINFGPSSGPLSVMIYIVLGLLGLVVLVAAIYIYLLAQIGSYILVRDREQNLRVWPTFKAARPLVSNFFETNLLTSVIIMLWFLLLIVPGIIMAVYYSFVTWVFIMEGLKNKAAMRRSKELVKGNWWSIFWKIFLPTMVVSLIFAIPSSFIEPETTADSVYSAFTDILSLIIAPFFLIYTYNLYRNLVALKNNNSINNQN